MGTASNYFEYFHYGKKQPLSFSSGQAFEQVYEAVIGADIASKLDYGLGSKMTLSHGVTDTHFSRHDDSSGDRFFFHSLIGRLCLFTTASGTL